jgi:hypothetical protein
MKQSFLHSELWILTFGGAFQRAGLYNKDITVDEDDRTNFRNKLKEFITVDILPQYKVSVSEDIHIANVHRIVNFSTQYDAILNNGSLNFGVAQKLLNLLLKYHWCIGEITEPPHFPVDRIIQKEIRNKIINWTDMTEVADYKNIIEAARVKATEMNMSLAMWELIHFNRNITG